MEKDTRGELILALEELVEHLRYWLGGGEFISPNDPLNDALRRLDNVGDVSGIPHRVASHCRFRKERHGYYLNGDWTVLESIKLSDFDRVKPYDWVHIEDIDEIARCQVFRGFKHFVVYPKAATTKFRAGVATRLFISFPIGDYHILDFMTVTNPSNPELHSVCVCALEQLDSDWSFFHGELYDEFCHSAFVYLNGWKMRVERFVEAGRFANADGRNGHATTVVAVPEMPNIQLSRKRDQLLRSIWTRADWTKSPVRAKRSDVAADVYEDEEKAESSTIRTLMSELVDKCLEKGVELSLNNRGDWIEIEYFQK